MELIGGVEELGAVQYEISMWLMADDVNFCKVHMRWAALFKARCWEKR
jgi:hypothetical protein